MVRLGGQAVNAQRAAEGDIFIFHKSNNNILRLNYLQIFLTTAAEYTLQRLGLNTLAFSEKYASNTFSETFFIVLSVHHFIKLYIPLLILNMPWFSWQQIKRYLCCHLRNTWWSNTLHFMFLLFTFIHHFIFYPFLWLQVINRKNCSEVIKQQECRTAMKLLPSLFSDWNTLSV